MRKTLFDIPIDWIAPEELEHKLRLFVTSKKPHQITTVNPEFIVLSKKNEAFKSVLQQSDLSLPDGTGIILAQTFLESHPVKNVLVRIITYIILGFRLLLMPHSFSYKRITGVALSEQLMALSASEGWRVFLLGAGPNIAKEAGKIWQELYPGLEIVGTSSANPNDNHIVAHIHQAKPDVLLVAYGAPKQDVFIAHHKEALKVPVMVGVGGTFDYVVGALKRPSEFTQRIGLEWLARLFQQPKRFSRIWRSTITFSRLIISQRDS